MVEEPPEEATSCNSALNLTPKQLAEIFLAFGQTARQSHEEDEQEGNQKEISRQSRTTSSPLSVNSSTSEKSVCTPRVQSLERECNAFKKIVKQDAKTILNLQRAVDTQKQLCQLKEVEIVDKQTELQIAEERIARLKKEREEYFERETELMETIKILKQEIDKMTLKSDASFDRIEMQKIETELSLFKSQLEEQKERVFELETNLKEKDKTNFDLQTEIDWLKSQQKRPSNGESGLSSDITGYKGELGDLLLEEDPVSSPGIANVLQSFSKRIESLEKEKEEREEIFLQEIKRNNTEMERIRNLLQDDSKEKNTIVQVSEDPEEIEAMPLNKNSSHEHGHGKLSCCCDWTFIAEE
jgi:chromosome segregation ATPase